MNIYTGSYDPYLMGVSSVGSVGQTQGAMPQQQPPKLPGEDQELDQYIPGMQMTDMAMPSTNYNASGMMVGETESSDTDLMNLLSSTFRANADSIESTMDELGLTLDDLSDEENLTALADAMNEGAANLGLPTIDDLDSTVSSLYEAMMNAIGDNTEEEADAATEVTETAESDSASGSGSGSSSSDSETTTEVVTIDGVTYLQVTTTEDGVETVTRTVISGDDSDSSAVTL